VSLNAELTAEQQRVAEWLAERRGEPVADLLARLDEAPKENLEDEYALVGNDEIEADLALWRIIENKLSLAKAIEELCVFESAERTGLVRFENDQLHKYRTNPRLIFLNARADTLLSRYGSWSNVPEEDLYRADVTREELRAVAVAQFESFEKMFVQGIVSSRPEGDDPRISRCRAARPQRPNRRRESRRRRNVRTRRAKARAPSGDPSPEPEPPLPLDLLDAVVLALGWGRV
jgi:hypothetical protein